MIIPLDANDRASRDLKVREAQPGQGGRQSNQVYVEATNTSAMGGRGESRRWQELQVASKDVTALRRIKMGVIQGTKGSISRITRGWATLDDETKEAMLECPCGMRLDSGHPEDQDAVHVIRNCRYTGPTRLRILEYVADTVMTEGEDWERAVWQSKTDRAKLEYTMSTHCDLSLPLDQKIKSRAAGMWVEGMKKVSDRLRQQNAGFGAAVAAEVARREA